MAGVFCLMICSIIATADRPGQPAGSLSPLHGQTVDLIKKAGDRSLMTLVVRPEHWLSFRTRAAARLEPILTAQLRIPKKCFGNILQSPNALAALARAVGCLAGKDVEHFDEWKSWDSTRPIVAAVAEVSDDYVTPFTYALRGGRYYDKPTGFRHRILIPARNSRHLSDRIRKLFAQIGWKRVEDLDSSSLPNGASFHNSDDLGGFLCVIPEQGHVRVEITSSEAFVYVFAARAKDTDIKVAAAQYHEIMEGICRELAKKPWGAGKEILRTAAMHLVASSQCDFFSGLLRTWRVRPFGVYALLNVTLKAISYADAAESNQLLSKALEEAITADRLMSPVVAEVDDIGVSVSHTPTVKITQVIGLTRLGRKILHKGYALGGKEILSDLRSREFDARGAWSVALRHPVLSEEDGIEKAEKKLKLCGIGCSLYMELRGKMSVMKSLYLFEDNPNRHHMDSLLSKRGVVYDIGQMIPRMMNQPEFTRRAIAGRALVGEHWPASTGVKANIDLAGLSRVNWQSPEQSMCQDKSYRCFDRVRRMAIDALGIVVFSAHKPEDRAALKKKMEEMGKTVECTRNNPALFAKANSILGFLKSTSLARRP